LIREIKRRGEALSPDHVPDVYLAKYYNPFPTSWPSSGCPDIHPTLGRGIDSDEMDWLIAALGEVNGNIQEVADESEFSGMTIQTVNLGNVMNGHRWCSSDPYVYGVSIRLSDGSSPAPFHPTPEGQEAIYAKFKTCMNGGSCT
jgi:hypothetical protein